MGSVQLSRKYCSEAPIGFPAISSPPIRPSVRIGRNLVGMPEGVEPVHLVTPPVFAADPAELEVHIREPGVSPDVSGLLEEQQPISLRLLLFRIRPAAFAR